MVMCWSRVKMVGLRLLNMAFGPKMANKKILEVSEIVEQNLIIS